MRKLKTRNDWSLVDDETLMRGTASWMKEYEQCSPHSHQRKETIGTVLDDYQREMHNRGLKLCQ